MIATGWRFIALSAVVHVVSAAPCGMADLAAVNAAENKATVVMPMMQTNPNCATCLMGCATAANEAAAAGCALACAQDAQSNGGLARPEPAPQLSGALPDPGPGLPDPARRFYTP